MGGNSQSSLGSLSQNIKQNLENKDKKWYEKEKELGKGTFGTVHVCLHKTVQQQFALKIMHGVDQTQLSTEQRDRLDSVVKDLTIKDFHHDNIVKFYGHEYQEGKLFVYMELGDSGSLRQIYLKTALPEYLIGKYARDICKAVEYLHGMNYIHRDIKCDNVVVVGNHTAKLCDFGNAKLMEDTMRFTSSAVGSNYWSSPEMSSLENVGLSTDIWSIGATILELVIRDFPNLIDRRNHPSAKPFECYEDKNISNTCSNFIKKCLKINSNDRATISELLKSDLCNLYSSEDCFNYFLNIFIQNFREWSEERLKTIDMLNKFGEEMDKYTFQNNVCNISGASGGIVGTALTITGAALTPVTAGASLILLFTGLGIGLAGGAVSAGGTIGQIINTNSDLKDADLKIKMERLRTEKLVAIIEEIFILFIGKRREAELIMTYFPELKEKIKPEFKSCDSRKKEYGSMAAAATSSVVKSVPSGSLAGFRIIQNTVLDAVPIAMKFSIILSSIGAVIDLVTLIKYSIDIHKKNKSKAGEYLREKAKELEEELTKMKALLKEIESNQ